jgi:hypothetical protein
LLFALLAARKRILLRESEDLRVTPVQDANLKVSGDLALLTVQKVQREEILVQFLADFLAIVLGLASVVILPQL